MFREADSVRGKKSKWRMLPEMVGQISRERLCGVGRYTTGLAETEDDINENRRFATESFVNLGKINSDAVDSTTGLLKHDTMHEKGIVNYISTRYSGELVSVGKVACAPGLPMDELRTPFDQVRELNPEFYERLAALPDGSVGELGSLAKTPGVSQVAVLSTLSEIYRVAEDTGVEYLMAGLEPKAWPRYKQLFGSGIELVSGTPLIYPGINGPQVGISMDIKHAYEKYRNDFKVGSLSIRLQRILVSDLYSNRVDSFKPVLPIPKLAELRDIN